MGGVVGRVLIFLSCCRACPQLSRMTQEAR
jgi:hypothetical protein